MTAWHLFCAVHFADGLVVLGPKCHTSECLAPAAFTVWWPGQRPITCCSACTDRWQHIAARGLGFALATQPLYYTISGEDDAVQRFRLLELE